MSNPSICSITAGDLAAEATRDGDVVDVRLRGSAELGSREALDELFADVLAASTGCREVVVDICELEHMSSSSIKSLLMWILQVRDLAEPRRHKIRFLSNPSLHWQKRSLHALACMGGDLIDVEERTETP